VLGRLANATVSQTLPDPAAFMGTNPEKTYSEQQIQPFAKKRSGVSTLRR
jgi:hypothetical protein